MDLWGSERLQTIGEVLNRYSHHLRTGDRIRTYMEGDPCSQYRNAHDAPCGTVLQVSRDGAVVTFVAEMDDGGTRTFNNVSVAPHELWEIDPEYLNTFRGNVLENMRQKETVEPDPEEEPVEPVEDPDPPPPYVPSRSDPSENPSDYRRIAGESVDTVRDLEERFRRADDDNRSFRETIASAVRHLAHDIMRSSNGDTLQFAPNYCERFHSTLAEKASVASRHDFRAADYSPPSSPSRRSRGTLQKQKYDFTTPVEYSTLSQGPGTDLSEE